jgi:outer membrane protein OmpA-like peptidoglycan-associated protein
MKIALATRILTPHRLGIALLAAVLALPAWAQQANAPQSAPEAAAQQPPAAREGFWGRVNPFARKKWVNQRVDPLKDRLGELDQLSAKNAGDIKDVDGRAQAGIQKAQSTADAASQAAAGAASQAAQAGALAQSAAGRIDKLNSTIAGLDQYRQSSAAQIQFHGTQPVLSAQARKQLDDLASQLAGRQGYILDIEAHAPGAGGVGIQNSQRLAEAVKRYLVTEHQIPVFRLHAVGLGDAPAPGQQDARPVRSGSVQIRLMENTLAATSS